MTHYPGRHETGPATVARNPITRQLGPLHLGADECQRARLDCHHRFPWFRSYHDGYGKYNSGRNRAPWINPNPRLAHSIRKLGWTSSVNDGGRQLGEGVVTRHRHLVFAIGRATKWTLDQPLYRFKSDKHRQVCKAKAGTEVLSLSSGLFDPAAPKGRATLLSVLCWLSTGRYRGGAGGLRVVTSVTSYRKGDRDEHVRPAPGVRADHQQPQSSLLRPAPPPAT